MVLLLGASLVSCSGTERETRPADSAPGPAISPNPPQDIEGGAFTASLSQAAEYSWEQMIAMHWPAAMVGETVPVRGRPAGPDQPSRVNRAAPRVWHTLRSKTETFPGTGDPHGSELGPAQDYGYDQPPLYRYDPASVGRYPGIEPGVVPACKGEDPDGPTPWVELSESHEVGPEQMYAGMAPFESDANRLDRQRVLYSVNVDRSFYAYVAAHGWLDGGNKGTTVPADATVKYLDEHNAAPPPGSTSVVSFPSGSLQIKSAWRRLTESERASGRFLTSLNRAYQAQDPNATYRGVAGNKDYPCYVDAHWGLVGIHFKTRTATAPYYIWSTFEHVDNLVDTKGSSVEDSAGRYTGDPNLPPTDPHITSRNAVAANPPTIDTIQKTLPATANATPGKRLYYRNTAGTPTTQGIVAVNRREHPIAEPVVTANEVAHAALRRFLQRSDSREVLPQSLLNYRLVGVQWRPADKPVPGQDVEADPNQSNEVLRYTSIYYLANLTLETSYRLQNYSGTTQSHLPPPNHDLSVQDLVTDFDASGMPVKNLVYGGLSPDGQQPGFNMGGCMGCHGQIQLKGYDFNFIFRRGRVNKPEMDVSIRLPLIDMVHPTDRQ